jgi:hypothetical protein
MQRVLMGMKRTNLTDIDPILIGGGGSPTLTSLPDFLGLIGTPGFAE